MINKVLKKVVNKKNKIKENNNNKIFVKKTLN